LQGKGDDLNFYVLKEASNRKSNRKISLNKSILNFQVLV